MTDITTRTIEIPAGSLEVHEIGEGAPVLFIHGALVGWELWEPLARPLAARGYRVIMPTLPLGAHETAMRAGTDLTPPGLARIIVDIISALDLAPATVVSNDTCTAIQQLVLTQHRGAIGRSIMTSGDCFRYFFPPIFRPLQALGYAPFLIKRVAQGMGSATARKAPFAFGWLTQRGIPDDVAQSWTRSIRNDKGVRRDAAAVLRGINVRHTLAAAKLLPQVDVPVMLVWAEDDRAFPMKLAHRLAALIPDCRLETVPDAACFVSRDNPDHVVDLIADFVPLSAGSRLPSGT